MTGLVEMRKHHKQTSSHPLAKIYRSGNEIDLFFEETETNDMKCLIEASTLSNHYSLFVMISSYSFSLHECLSRNRP